VVCVTESFTLPEEFELGSVNSSNLSMVTVRRSSSAVRRLAVIATAPARPFGAAFRAAGNLEGLVAFD
jgi:hypothetical protein